MNNLSNKHNSHEVKIHPGSGPHYRSLRCSVCNKHIMHLSKSQYHNVKNDVEEVREVAHIKRQGIKLNVLS